MAAHEDSAWKDILDARFEAFLEFFFPDIHRDVDWTRGHEALDKELEPILRIGPGQKRLADKLVKVRLRGGRLALVLIHVEVQGTAETDFARRMYQYNYRIFERYQEEVISLAVLTDSRASFRPDSYRRQRWGFEVCMRFPVVKLLDYQGRRAELETSSNPFAVVVLAHLESRQARSNPLEALDVKWRLARMLYERGHRREDIITLYKFIDWVLRLPDELDVELESRLRTLEGQRTMPYVSHIERFAIERGKKEGIKEGIEKGIEKGIERGRAEGLREGLLQAIALGLKLRFGPEGLELLPRAQGLKETRRLRAFLSAVYKSRDLAGLREKLPRS